MTVFTDIIFDEWIFLSFFSFFFKNYRDVFQMEIM